MKKLYTRIAACSLAVLIAFNTVAIPKSRAVVVESALSSAIIGTYLTATGFAFTGKDIAVGTPADMYIAERLDIFLRDWSEAMDKTDEEIRDVIVSGFEFVGDGVVKIGSAAAGLLASFADWLVDELGLIDVDGNPVENGTPFVYGDSTGVTYNGLQLPDIRPFWDESIHPYAYIYERTNGAGYALVLSKSCTQNLGYEDDTWKINEWGAAVRYYLTDNAWVYNNSYNSVLFSAENMIWSSFDILYSTTAPVEDTHYKGSALVEDSALILSVGLPSDYEAAPTVDEQYAMVIDTGMTIEDEQDFVDSVLGGMLAGTLAPTYTIEQAVGGDVVVPDEGEDTDTQAGILSTVKNIAQSVISLPQTIAEAIKGLFVPDAALTQEITDTFSAKFDFISDLHGLGTDLLNLDPEQTPPVIYIHLEDADSNYGFAYGGTTKALDMAWYEPYKEDVDRIISGFLWLGFLWLCFMRASDIINGAGMVYAAGQPTIYTPDSLHDAPRLEAPRWRRRGR